MLVNGYTKWLERYVLINEKYCKTTDKRDNFSRTKISRKAHFSRVTEVVECCQMCWNLHRMQHICSRYATKILICIGHFSVEILGNVLS